MTYGFSEFFIFFNIFHEFLKFKLWFRNFIKSARILKKKFQFLNLIKYMFYYKNPGARIIRPVCRYQITGDLANVKNLANGNRAEADPLIKPVGDAWHAAKYY